jgi:hypothetical protein
MPKDRKLMRCMYSKQLLAKKKKFSDGFLRLSSVGTTNFISLFATNASGEAPRGEPLDEGYVKNDMLSEESFILER